MFCKARNSTVCKQNEMLKKRKEQAAFYDRFQPSASPGKNYKKKLQRKVDTWTPGLV